MKRPKTSDSIRPSTTVQECGLIYMRAAFRLGFVIRSSDNVGGVGFQALLQIVQKDALLSNLGIDVEQVFIDIIFAQWLLEHCPQRRRGL